MADPIIYEATMSTTEFNRPRVLKDKAAMYTLLVRLALLEPGTIQTHPEMGLGLRSRYRYMFANDLSSLIAEYRRQIDTYLSDFNKAVSIKAAIEDHTLFLEVTIDDTVFPLYINTETFELENLIA